MVLDSDIFTYIFSNPQYFPLAVMAFSGYVFFASFYRKTKYWNEFSATERALLGGALGIFIGIFLVTPVVQVLLFWFVGSQAYTVNLASTFVFLMVAVEVFFTRISGYRERAILRYFSTSLLLVTGFLWLAFVAATVMSFSVSSYEPYVALIIQQSWTDFRQVSLWGFILSVFGLIVLKQSILKHLHTALPADISVIGLPKRRSSPGFSRGMIRSIMGRKAVKILIACTIVVFIVSAAMIPLDKTFTLFTPRLSAGRESFYASEGCPETGYIVIIRYNDGNSKFYQLMQLPYNVSMPALRLLQYVSVPNPSNFSSTVREPTGIPLEPWMYLSASGSNRVSFLFEKSSDKVTRVIANLSSVTNSSVQFTIFYWQQFLKRNVIVREMRDAKDIGDGTSLERHTFIISNNERICLQIPRVEMEELARQGTNTTLAKVYANGTLFPFPVDRRAFYPWTPVYPGKTLNLTITFPVVSI